MNLRADKTYTVADYRATPDEPPWYQLIDGHLLEDPPPSRHHQGISRNIGFALQTYLERRPIGRMYYAPFGFYVDDFNVLLPDVVVILKPRLHLLTDAGLEGGAPDFVVEILSPSTRKWDLGPKKGIYAKAGVRELWFVDPLTRSVEAHRFDGRGADRLRLWTEGDNVKSPLFPGLSLPGVRIFSD